MNDKSGTSQSQTWYGVMVISFVYKIYNIWSRDTTVREPYFETYMYVQTHRRPDRQKLNLNLNSDVAGALNSHGEFPLFKTKFVVI